MSPFVAAGANPHVTVFIPTWNGGPLFEEVLRELKAQETPFDFEILCIDSGSTDGTVERIERHGLRLIRIPNHEFNHGLTRNRAIREARGELVVLTVQDATPASRDWLVTMVSNFADPEVAGVYCNQLPRPDCSPFLRARLANWVKGGGTPIVRRVASPEVFWKELSPLDRYWAIAFDNVASVVRRSIALRHPFQERRFGEDVTWAKGAVLAGFKIVMEPRVAVVHSHRNSVWYEFRRAYLDNQNLHDLVGIRFVKTLREVAQYSALSARQLFEVVWSDATLGLPERLLWTLRVIPFAFTQNLGQYLGALSNVHGRRGLWKLWDRVAGRGV